MATPRVTLVLNALHGGGAEHVGRTWARELSGRGHLRELVVLEEPTAEQVDRAAVGVPVSALGGDRRHRLAELRRRVALGPGEASADVVVLALQMMPNLLVLAAGASVPAGRRARLAISERNIVSVPAGRPGPGHRAKVALARRAYRRADVMVAISHPVAAEMVAAFGVRPERCRVVPNPAATVPARPVTSPAAGLDVELVVVGRLAPQKRVGLALETARELAGRGLRVRLSLYGDGPERDALRSAAVPGVEVAHHGWVEDWPAACHTNSVLLLTSLKEGFGNVLVEAASRRVPCVALSGALGVADALVPGVTGALALDARPATVADAVLEARSCTFAGAEDWLARFTPATSTGLLLRALEPAGGPR